MAQWRKIEFGTLFGWCQVLLVLGTCANMILMASSRFVAYEAKAQPKSENRLGFLATATVGEHGSLPRLLNLNLVPLARLQHRLQRPQVSKPMILADLDQR